jgi:ubiquinone/menaquinone biosynthesis C-methylase UbiE
MKSLADSIALSMDCQSIELVPYLPYILQDFHELGSHAELLSNIVNELKPDKKINVIDLGCGKGAVLCKIAEKMDSVCLGIDAVASFIQYAHEYKNRKRIKNCTFIVGDIRNLHDIKGSYDFIIMGSIGPVFGNYTIALESLKTILEDDGCILLDEGYTENGKKHPITLGKEELFAQINRAGMHIAREYTGQDICITDEFAGQLDSIKMHCNELIEKFPEKEMIFRKYIEAQEAEYKALEDEITCSTMVLKKNA